MSKPTTKSAASSGTLFVSLLVASIVASPHALTGQQVETATLEGRVRDVRGGALAGAIVQVSTQDGRRVGVRETSPLGQYRIAGLAAGTYRLSVRRISYRPDTSQVTLTRGQTLTLDITLAAAPIALEPIEVRVNAEQAIERVRFIENAGTTRRTLTGPDMKRVPGLIEPDPVRAVEVLPGVVSTSDFTAAFNVRGGSADQNLILLDGAPVFNPFHLLGMFSVFNSDMMERAELLSGGFSAEHGGRVSSVLTVESDAGDGDLHGDIGVSLLASRLALGWRVPDVLANAIGFESMRWRVSGRRSYIDQLSSGDTEVPYHLVDGQGVLEAWTAGGSRLQITAYSGRDVLNPDPEFLQEDSTDSEINLDWTLGNDVVGARWTAPKADGGFVEVHSSYSRFNNEFGLDVEDSGFDLVLRSGIEAFRGGIDLEEHLGQSWTICTGVGTERLEYENLVDVNNARFDGSFGDGWLHSGYLQANWADHGWLVEAGVRFDHWRPQTGEAKWEPGPRLAVKRFLGGENAAIKLAAGRYTQFLHSLRDEQLPIGVDNWLLTGEQAPVVVSNQVQVGYEQYLGSHWFASIEGYLRLFDGLTTLNNSYDPNDASDYLLRGDGTSYGADLFLRRTGEGVTGWLAVSWLKANRTFPDILSGLEPAPDIESPAIFDRRLDIDLVLRYETIWGVESGLRFNFGTGMPYTEPIGQYGLYETRYGIGDGRLEAATYLDEDDESLQYEYGIILGPRAGARYPYYSRLDLSFRKTYEKSWGRITPYLSVLNVTNKRNAMFYFHEFDESPPTRKGVAMFPVLPTFGVEISF